MKLGIIAGMGSDWRASIDKVRIADSLGYSMVTTGEAWGPSSLPWLTLLATHTDKIRIGTSILNVYSRSPGAIAQEFATLEMLSGGRMVIGLGSSGHRVIEHFHGIPFETPLRRIRGVRRDHQHVTQWRGTAPRRKDLSNEAWISLGLRETKERSSCIYCSDHSKIHQTDGPNSRRNISNPLAQQSFQFT